MAGWHHHLDGCEFESTLGDGDGQGGVLRFMRLTEATQHTCKVQGICSQLIGKDPDAGKD